MESKSILEKIISKYVAINVLEYVKDGELLLFNLAKYCKRLQGSFKLTKEDYMIRYLETIHYSKFEKFLYVKRSSKFKKNYLNNIFKEEFKHYDDNIKKIISNGCCEYHFSNKYKFYQSHENIKKKILDNQLIIDIQSPFYNSLSKNPIFSNLFVIRLPLPLIKENDLMKDYLEEFGKLKKSNNNYSALCFQFDIDTKSDNKNLNFNVDFKKINKIIFEEKSTKYNSKCNMIEHENSTYDDFLLLKTILTNNDVVNNLLFLEIKFRINRNTITLNDLKYLDDFKNLEELRLENIIFSKNIILKLNTLKYLALCNCNQIGLSNNCALNLKSLSLFRSSLRNSNQSCLKLPELEQLKISFCNYAEPFNSTDPIKWFEHFRRTIDFKSLKKLKFLFRGDVSLFLDLENNLLEKAYISTYTLRSDFSNGKKIELEMIKIFIDIKTLKEIKLSLLLVRNKDLESIEGVNTSVKKLIIDFNDFDDYKLLYILQKKFPNLTEIEVYDKSNIRKINLEPNSKIERLKYSRLDCYFKEGGDISVHSLEFLKELELRNVTHINTPIFDENYSHNFKSLIKFQLDNSNNPNELMDLKLINNMINNIIKIPSLKCLTFKCISNIEEKEYIDLIQKILRLKVKSIEFGIKGLMHRCCSPKIPFNEVYEEKELLAFCQNIDFLYFEKIKIFKFNELN